MAFTFKETFSVTIPDVEEKLASFSESEFSSKHGLIVEIAAIHEGTTGNYTHYSAKELEKSITTWLQPYSKPIIMNHDKLSEPVGRVVGAKMDKESDGTPYVRLQAAITDPIAIQKVMDKRYLTGSVGGQAEEALCNICNANWAEASGPGGACAHKRGKSYRGKIAEVNMKDLSFKEYSFVNIPADTMSGVRSIATEISEGEEWAKPARFFVLDLGNESIVEYTESAEVDVLGEMKKKEASPIYIEMKGAFLEAQIVNKIEGISENHVLVDTKDEDGIAESDSEENQMANEDTAVTENEDDILAVTEQLSDEMSAVAEEAQDKSDAKEEEADSASEEDTTVSEEPVEEVERPAGQEKAGNKDVDPEDSAGAPKSRESEDEADNTVAAEGTQDSEDEATNEEGEEGASESEEETELNKPEDDGASEEAVEPEVNELSERIQTLEEENGRLKKALHRVLAERVVDAKISVGMIASETRGEEVNEHADRSASSLADSLRDLSAMPKVAKSTAINELEINPKTEIVEDELNTTTIGEEDDSDTVNADLSPENRLVESLTDTLMGRRSLQL